MTATLERWFQLRAHGTKVGTEVRAGVTTFMVMAYIIFVNPIILGFVGVPGLEGKGLPFAATLGVTCLTAGVLSIAMGLVTNYPFALAPVWASTPWSPSSWWRGAASPGPRP